MIRNPGDLSVDEKTHLEEPLGGAVADNASIAIHTFNPASAPEWLEASWDSAKRFDVDRLSSEEIEAEIAAFRKERRDLIGSPEPRPVTGHSKEQ